MGTNANRMPAAYLWDANVMFEGWAMRGLVYVPLQSGEIKMLTILGENWGRIESLKSGIVPSNVGKSGNAEEPGGPIELFPNISSRLAGESGVCCCGAIDESVVIGSHTENV